VDPETAGYFGQDREADADLREEELDYCTTKKLPPLPASASLWSCGFTMVSVLTKLKNDDLLVLVGTGSRVYINNLRQNDY
jgi:hypothetical protein